MNSLTYVSEQSARRYRSAGWWQGSTILDDLSAAVARQPAATAVVGQDGRRISFTDLDAESQHVAEGLLNCGLAKGDVVSVQLPNWIEFVIVHLAVTRLGGITLPLIPAFGQHETLEILRKCRVSVAFVPGQYRDCDFPAMYAQIKQALPNLARVVVVKGVAPASMTSYADLCTSPRTALPKMTFRGDDVTALTLTSGTEGSPKAAAHSHDTMGYGTRILPKLLGLTHQDVIWAPASLGHATAFQWGMRLALGLGCKLVLQDTGHAEKAMRAIEAEGCTFAMVDTPIVRAMLDGASRGRRRPSSMRLMGCVGEPVPLDLGAEVEEELGCGLVGMWGMSECFVGSSSHRNDSKEKQWCTDGRAVPGSELAVFDGTRTRMLPPGEVGELATRGPHVALGYFNDRECTLENFSPEGWLFTGDFASLDADGYMRIVARKRDAMDHSGLRVRVREIEDALLFHPLVSEAALTTVPDGGSRQSFRFCAFVVLSGDGKLELADLVRFLEEQGMAKQKLPDLLVRLPRLPRTASGKVARFSLRGAIANSSVAACAAGADKATELEMKMRATLG